MCRRGDRSVGQIAKDFDLTETAVRLWVSQAEADAGDSRVPARIRDQVDGEALAGVGDGPPDRNAACMAERGRGHSVPSGRQSRGRGRGGRSVAVEVHVTVAVGPAVTGRRRGGDGAGRRGRRALVDRRPRGCGR
ncbi:hypothetical protein ABT147_09220 [Streptomyces sp. NPDC001868]|uniref:hypothetical protein n=1 Tax=Streptomyces sp. NPDC001868 TaxID=3154401 RepID=UPI0033208C1A